MAGTSGTYSPLEKTEIESNEICIVNAISNCSLSSSAPQEQINEIQKALLAFTEEHRITLNNLEHGQDHDEWQQLVGIIERAFHEGAVSKEALESWKKGLIHAVGRQGAHVALHEAQEKSIAYYLLRGEVVPADKWGTDDDARCYFKNRITAPCEIKKAGLFVLPPISLTEGDGSALEGVLKEVKDAIGKEKITGPVNLLILANHSNSHWVMLKIGIENQAIQLAECWDPLPPPLELCDAMKKPAFMAFKNALKVFHEDTVPDPIYNAKGVQRDNHNCLYHCLAEMEDCLAEGSLKDLDSSSHQKGDQLRFAVVEKIVNNHESLRGKTVELQLDGTITLSPPIPEVSSVAETENGSVAPTIASKESPLDQINSRPTEDHSPLPTEPSPVPSSTSVAPSSTDTQREVDQLSKIVEMLDGIAKQGSGAKESERNWQLDFDLAMGIELDRLFMQAKGLVDEKALFEDARKQAARQVGLFSGGYQRKIKYKTEETSSSPPVKDGALPLEETSPSPSQRRHSSST